MRHIGKKIKFHVSNLEFDLELGEESQKEILHQM